MHDRHGSPTFYNLLDEMASLHERKSHDYTEDSDPFGNYRFAGTIANMFSHSPLDAGFAGRMAEKMFRLSVLESSGKTPKNESVADTERDIAVIAVLWMAARINDREKPNPLQTELFDLIKLMPDSQTTEIMNFICDLRQTRELHKRQAEVSQERPLNANHVAQTAQTLRSHSEEAACEMIRLDSYLSSADRQQMIHYLQSSQQAEAKKNGIEKK